MQEGAPALASVYAVATHIVTATFVDVARAFRPERLQRLPKVQQLILRTLTTLPTPSQPHPKFWPA